MTPLDDPASAATGGAGGAGGDTRQAAPADRVVVRAGELPGRSASGPSASGLSTGPAVAAETATGRVGHQRYPVENGPHGPGPTPDVTVVLPCYNEAAHVLAEIDRISAAFDASELVYEVLCIDDSSTDDTLAVLRKAQHRYPKVRVLAFRRNGGSG
ncbi:MAG: glycosyltransferase, partial [Dermatophilaceae bacterium]